MYQEARIRFFFSSARMRGVATSAPNSPRDTGVGEVMPRAMKPDIASKSKVKQARYRAIGFSSKNSDLRTACHQAAIHQDFGSGDVLGLVGSKIERRIGNVPCISPTPQGYAHFRLGAQSGEIEPSLLLRHAMREQGCIDQSGNNGIAAYSFRSVAHRKLARELHQSGLGRRVADMIMSQMAQAADRADVGDDASPLALHHWQDGLAADEGAGQIQVELRTELLHGHFFRTAGNGPADIVVQNVDAPKDLPAFLDHGAHRGEVGDIQLCDFANALLLQDGCRRRFGGGAIAIDQHDFCAFAREKNSSRAAISPTRTD